MTVNDCMREIRAAKDEIEILEAYKNDKTHGIAAQHIDEIIETLYHYIDIICEKTVS